MEIEKTKFTNTVNLIRIIYLLYLFFSLTSNNILFEVMPRFNFTTYQSAMNLLFFFLTKYIPKAVVRLVNIFNWIVYDWTIKGKWMVTQKNKLFSVSLWKMLSLWSLRTINYCINTCKLLRLDINIWLFARWCENK